MRLIDDLRAEHEVIERVLGSLRTYLERRARGDGAPSAGEGFLRFFRLWAGGYHHAREEETLLPALEKHLELAPRTGPVFSIADQHRKMEATLAGLAPLLLLESPTRDEAGSLVTLFTVYSHALLVHIDAENSVLLPESDERLRRAGVHELPARDATPEELAARAEGERLATLFPPSHDPSALRGEGCVICPSYGTTCGGVEREWWNESEWDRLRRGLE